MLKRTEFEADHSILSSAKFKNEWSDTFPPDHVSLWLMVNYSHDLLYFILHYTFAALNINISTQKLLGRGYMSSQLKWRESTQIQLLTKPEVATCKESIIQIHRVLNSVISEEAPRFRTNRQIAAHRRIITVRFCSFCSVLLSAEIVALP
jgi:hypothetical protein